ncbi:MAG: S46 family peptidase, partial [Bacteroidales bacterium]|nr:S46 family peptidase [Bacteroidales bacterium]
MKRLFLSMALIISVLCAKADEGMWLPYSLSDKSLAEMQQLGCKLTAEQIFNLNQPSLKDAIVQFGGGCTGELISPEGLILTNHHCGLSYVQKHATVEHDYLTDGFWAYSKAEELPNPGLTVSFLAYVEDVTEAVLEGVNDEETRNEIIEKNIEKIVKERKGERDVTIEIVPFYAGNQYILFEYDVYRDVRLVCCPPWGIGKYGADTDNWTWPRHKGDFNIFRVYTDRDGKPAKYSENNIPMQSRHYLPINIKGVKPGDYAMILGYPGST